MRDALSGASNCDDNASGTGRPCLDSERSTRVWWLPDCPSMRVIGAPAEVTVRVVRGVRRRPITKLAEPPRKWCSTCARASALPLGHARGRRCVHGCRILRVPRSGGYS